MFLQSSLNLSLKVDFDFERNTHPHNRQYMYFDKYNKYHRIQVALIHKYFLSNCLSSDDATNERKVYRTIVMIDFVLEIINTPYWGLLVNKNKNRDNLI